MVIRFFAYLRDYTKTKEITIDQCATLEELLRLLCSKYGKNFADKAFKDGKLSNEIIILVNGRHIAHLDSVKTKLHADDVISIFPVVAGG